MSHFVSLNPTLNFILFGTGTSSLPLLEKSVLEHFLSDWFLLFMQRQYKSSNKLWCVKF